MRVATTLKNTMYPQITTQAVALSEIELQSARIGDGRETSDVVGAVLPSVAPLARIAAITTAESV